MILGFVCLVALLFSDKHRVGIDRQPSSEAEAQPSVPLDPIHEKFEPAGPSHEGLVKWQNPLTNTEAIPRTATEQVLSIIKSNGVLSKRSEAKWILDTLRREKDPRGAIFGVIDKLSPPQLTSILINSIGLTTLEISKIPDVRSYAKALATTAMEGVITPQHERNNTPRIDLSNMLSLTPSVSVPSFNAFPVENRKIYATLALNAYQESGIIAKWFRKDDPSLFSIQRHALEPGANEAMVWMLNTNGWNKGEYVVQFIAVSQDCRRLGEASFSVY